MRLMSVRSRPGCQLAPLEKGGVPRLWLCVKEGGETTAVGSDGDCYCIPPIAADVAILHNPAASVGRRAHCNPSARLEAAFRVAIR